MLQVDDTDEVSIDNSVIPETFFLDTVEIIIERFNDGPVEIEDIVLVTCVHPSEQILNFSFSD